MAGEEEMLIGNVRADVCLAYANTLSWRGGAAPIETLLSFGDLLAWTVEWAGLDREVVADVGRWARAQPSMATDLFGEAIALREVIYRIFRSLAAGGPASDQDLAALNEALDDVPARNRVAAKSDGYAWRIGLDAITGPTLLAPILWSAGDLMVSERVPRVRLCANETCLWLFLDESKAGTRRWCDMASCGNRAKARRHYQRIRQA